MIHLKHTHKILFLSFFDHKVSCRKLFTANPVILVDDTVFIRKVYIFGGVGIYRGEIVSNYKWDYVTGS